MIMMNNGGDEAVRVQKGGGCDGKMLRWENLIPRGSLRVLLVESDESTRQVIAALLRKCYFIVAAVSDGLAAWEVLKQKPKGIDLILTEVELPSISGFALLTLIMENDSCKNIPVIMMSKNDSVSMVYKCMLRGAADVLVKPVRKNELQNLWQHVWRRQANACGGQGVQDESITQQKREGLLDNVLIIDDDECGVCTPKNEECNAKGNDAQSSCSDFDGVMMGLQEDFGCTKLYEDRNTLAEASDNNDALISGSREAIDLIGTFQNHSTETCVKSPVINGINKNDSSPRLDLSLRRFDDTSFHQDIALTERGNVVHRANGSAFSRYVAAKPTHCIQVNTQRREYEGSSDNYMPGPIQPINLRINNSHLNTQTSSVNQESSDLKQGERPFSGLQIKMLPVTVHVNGVRPNRMCTSNGSGLHPSYYNHLNASPTPSLDSNPNTSSFINQMALGQDPNLETRGSIKNASSERSQNSSLSNAVTGRHNSSSNGSSNPVEGITAQEDNTNRSSQRAEALNKFRLKRKDRCFEKKVRYESRKKLAEQRPRVKGQFVRQAPTDPSTVTTS